MASDSFVFGLLVLGVVAGVAMVALSEAVEGLGALLPIGGVVGLLAIAGLTAAIMSIEGSGDADAGH